jgi:ABC-2 type transport system permease protein
MLAAWRSYSTILRISISERLMYRGDFAFATLLRFLPIVTQIFLWGAIYGVQTGGSQGQRLNGYTYADMVAYYLLAMAGRAFSSMPGLASGIARDVREGAIKKYLTQPVDMLGYLFCARVAHKLVYYLIAAAPFALVFFLCRNFFREAPDACDIAAFTGSLLAAFIIGFLLESLIGLIAFWFLDVSSLIFIYMMVTYFLSGHMLPLDWLPAPLGTWVQYLPFKYLAHVPATMMLHKYTHAELAQELLVAVGWIVVLIALNRLVFLRGVRRYSAFGG